MKSIREIRKTSLGARRALDNEYRHVASAKIANSVIRSHEFNAARSLACYLPMSDEVDSRPIIARAWRAKKRVFVPVIDSNGGMVFRRLQPESRLEQNFFGLWEPATGELLPARRLDLVITPLVAFDARNNRIGMGGGYFDRQFAFLKHRRHWHRPKLIGVAFACQRVEKIEANPWDIPVYSVIDETT